MAAPLTSSLLMVLMLTSSLAFLHRDEKVLADLSERGRIVSASYWQKFRVFMDEVAAADFVERTDMLTQPDAAEALAPTPLLRAIAARLNDSEWLKVLDDEYRVHGEHNMTVLIETLHKLGQLAEKHKETVPLEVLRQLVWRGVVRPERQHEVEIRLVAALQLFFDTPLAVRLQRDEPKVFEEYLIGVFEFDWMPIEDILEDTLSHHQLKAQLDSKAGRAASSDHPSFRRYIIYGGQPGFSNTKYMPAEPETFLPTPSVGEPALDTVGRPADWDHRVHEADVEVVHGSVDDHDWHGGGFIGPDAPGGGGTSVLEKFSQGPHQEGSGKEVREAHHQGYHPHRHQRPEEDPNEDGLLAAAADTSEEGSGKDSGEDDLRENHRKGPSGGRSAPGGMSSEEADEAGGEANHSSEETDEEDKANRPPIGGTKPPSHTDRDGPPRGAGKQLEAPAHPEHRGSSLLGHARHGPAGRVDHHQGSEGLHRGAGAHSRDAPPHGSQHQQHTGSAVAVPDPALDSSEASGSVGEAAEWLQGIPPGLPQQAGGE